MLEWKTYRDTSQFTHPGESQVSTASFLMVVVALLSSSHAGWAGHFLPCWMGGARTSKPGSASSQLRKDEWNAPLVFTKSVIHMKPRRRSDWTAPLRAHAAIAFSILCASFILAYVKLPSA